jgi:hypothetical protein
MIISFPNSVWERTCRKLRFATPVPSESKVRETEFPGRRFPNGVWNQVNGKWTSKLGNEEDIEHDTPESVAGGLYGDVVLIMKRKRTATST